MFYTLAAQKENRNAISTACCRELAHRHGGWNLVWQGAWWPPAWLQHRCHPPRNHPVYAVHPACPTGWL